MGAVPSAAPIRLDTVARSLGYTEGMPPDWSTITRPDRTPPGFGRFTGKQHHYPASSTIRADSAGDCLLCRSPDTQVPVLQQQARVRVVEFVGSGGDLHPHGRRRVRHKRGKLRCVRGTDPTESD